VRSLNGNRGLRAEDEADAFYDRAIHSDDIDGG
jgi:hypothetical protein